MTANVVLAAQAGGVQVVAAAAAHLKRMYAFAPFASCPPVPAALVAAISVLAGGSERVGYWVAAVIVWLAAGWAARSLVRSANFSNSAPWLAAVVLLVAPSRLWMLLIAPDLPRLLFWTVATFVLTALFARHKSSTSRIAQTTCLVILAAGSHPTSVHAIDILAALELAVLAALGKCASCSKNRVQSPIFARGFVENKAHLTCENRMTVPIFRRSDLRHGLLAVVRTPAANNLRCAAISAAAASLVAACWHYSVMTYSRYDPGPPPPELESWLGRESIRNRVFENETSLGLIEQPGLSIAAEAIASRWSVHESLLWLRAFAAEYVVSADWLKYHSRLDPVFESGEWFVYRLGAPNPAEAVLVSLPGWTRLPEIRGLRDDEGLAAYLDWSGRPEQAGIVWDNPREATITADLGEFDAILVRRAAAAGWRAALVDTSGNESEFPVGSDPLGYMVLAPRVAGPVTLRLRYQPGLIERLWPSPPRAQELLIGAFPSISPNGVVDAANYTPPPFPPGALISIYGRGFIEGATRVIVSGQSVIPLYTGPNQINVSLPESLPSGKVDIIVEVGGAHSTPHEIEVAAP